MLSVMLLIDIPMDINSKFEVSVRSVICVIGTTAIIVAGAAWSIAMLTKQKPTKQQRIENLADALVEQAVA